jgi:hypothetical protein
MATCLQDVPLGTASWLVEVGGGRLVLRRCHAGVTRKILATSTRCCGTLPGGWVAPEPAGVPAEHAGLRYCPDPVRARPGGRRGTLHALNRHG